MRTACFFWRNPQEKNFKKMLFENNLRPLNPKIDPLKNFSHRASQTQKPKAFVSSRFGNQKRSWKILWETC